MMNETLLKQRLEALEHAVAELQAHLADRTKSSDWLEKVKGSVTDEEVFRCETCGRILYTLEPIPPAAAPQSENGASTS